MQHAFDLPQTGFIALATLAGLAMGGWLTLLTHRLPRMMEREWQAHCSNADPHHAAAYGLHEPASYCTQCEAPVTGWRKLPVAGWLLLKGRCAVCGMAIGWRNPAIELLTAALFAACAWRFEPTLLALYGMALSAALVALAWIDLESRLLPDALTLPLVWAGLVVNLGNGFTPLPLAVLGAVAGYGFLWVICHAWRLCTGQDGMGYGDFKLLAALGAWFGVDALPMLLLGASLAAMLVGGTLILIGRARRGQPLPFGPYLALAGISVLVLGGELELLSLLP